MILLKGPAGSLATSSTTRQKKENKPRRNLGSEARLREIVVAAALLQKARARSINTNPPAAFVGLTEAEAKASGESSYEVVTMDLESTRSGIEPRGNVIKVLYDHSSRRVLSCLAIGPDSSEIVNLACFWLSTNTPMESFLNISTIHPSPTEYMVRALRRYL